MIESRLDPAVDGAGGGYGRYPGLTTVQVAERFRFLVEEGQGRSARAILRIVHEQTEARGRLGVQRIVVLLGVIVTVFLGGLSLVIAPETRAGVVRAALAAGAVTAVFAAGAATMHRTTARADAQVREIQRLALVALHELTSRDGFVAKALDREHLASLRELRKIDPAVYARVLQALTA